MRNMRFTENPCPETQNKMVSSSKEVEVMVCGLDHSGSQPFIFKTHAGYIQRYS